jgi:hypothetical protein
MTLGTHLRFWTRTGNDRCASYPRRMRQELLMLHLHTHTHTHTHTKGLQVGSMYRVELGDQMNRIQWYIFGTKEEVLSEVGGTTRDECVDVEMERIPLVLQNEALSTL